MPVIIFMTDGNATDDYQKALQEIRKNRWFARGTKIGFAIGDDPDYKMLSSVVGNSEAVIKTTDLELFKRLMRFVSVTASMLVSQSATTNAVNTGGDIIRQAKQEMDIPSDVTVALDQAEYDPEPVWDEEDTGWDDGDW